MESINAMEFQDTRYRENTRSKPKKSQKYHHPINRWSIRTTKQVRNALSPANSRPGLQIVDSVKHDEEDFDVVHDLYRKTGCPRFHPRNASFAHNTQNHNERTVSSESLPSRTSAVCKMVRLPDIYEHLCLSNLAFAKDWMESEAHQDSSDHFDIVVNLSGCKLPKITRMKSDVGKLPIKVINIPIQDDHNVRYIIFRKQVTKFCEVLDQAVELNQRVLVHCKAGTNRSAVCAIAYALHKNSSIFNNEQSCKTAVDKYVRYIENRKLNEGHLHWDTMTNQLFLKYLQILYC